MAAAPQIIDNVQAIIDVARRGADWNTFNPTKDQSLAFVPDLGSGRWHDLETYLPSPKRKRGEVMVFDAASFNIVIADNSDAGDIAIYIDRNPIDPHIKAVLNGHGRQGAGWGDLRVSLAFRKTPQWERWLKIDGKMLPQAEFAEFIEDNLEDIADPPGATMLEIASYLQATRSADFRSAVRLSSGVVQLQNLESIDAKVGTSQIAIPEQFNLGIAPLLGATPYNVPVRFRYRIVDGKLMLGIKLQRIEDLMGRVLDDIIAKIERGTNVSVLEGVAPSATR